jgi:2,3-dihydroxybiphenyl 1,2-dioxygenase
MKVSGLGYVNLNVTDLPGWTKLVKTVYGMEVLERSDGAADLRIDEYHHRFSLYPSDKNSVRSIGWEVASPEDLAELVARLRGLGLKVSEANAELKAERKVRELVSFRDPTIDIPTELFYGPLAHNKAVNFARGLSGYITRGLGLGHVVFSCRDPKAAVKFYTEVLGFKVSDYIIWEDKDATFLHCNPRHHSMAIMNEFGPLKHGDLNHIMIEAKSFDDVGYAYDIVRDHKIPVMLDMGKHSNDHMQSFYIFSPSGFALEYGYGARVIEDDWEIRTYDQPMLFGHRFVGA